MKEILISEVQVIPIKPQNGLCAFASIVLNKQFFIGNLGIYSSPSSYDGFRVTFPNKKLPSGQIINCFHPICRESEEAVSSAIIKKYLEVMGGFKNVE